MTELNSIELRSQSVKEILKKPPKWIIRSGITAIMTVVIILLVGSYFFKYPDIIKANITITSENPPIPIVAKASGKLNHLFVKDNEYVKIGQVIGIVENPSKYSDIIALQKKLDKIGNIFNEEDFKVPLKCQFNSNYQLGSLQKSYAAFSSQWSKHKSILNHDYIGEQIKSLEKQVTDYIIYYSQLKNQNITYQKDLDLSKNQFIRDSLLFRKGVLSDISYEKSKASFLKQEYGFKGSLANLTNTQIKINQQKQQIIELKIKRSEQLQNSFTDLREKYENLTNQIVMWQETYLLKSAIDGNITFTRIWSINQYISSGSVVFTVVPEQEMEIIGKVLIPVSGSGKVKVGQEVNIKLDNYPYMEYGILRGTIVGISLIPEKEQSSSFYTAEVFLENKLITNYGLELMFHQEMQGTAEVVTDDKRLLQRFIQPMIAIFKENI